MLQKILRNFNLLGSVPCVVHDCMKSFQAHEHAIFGICVGIDHHSIPCTASQWPLLLPEVAASQLIYHKSHSCLWSFHLRVPTRLHRFETWLLAYKHHTCSGSARRAFVIQENQPGQGNSGEHGTYCWSSQTIVAGMYNWWSWPCCFRELSPTSAMCMPDMHVCMYVCVYSCIYIYIYMPQCECTSNIRHVRFEDFCKGLILNHRTLVQVSAFLHAVD